MHESIQPIVVQRNFIAKHTFEVIVVQMQGVTFLVMLHQRTKHRTRVITKIAFKIIGDLSMRLGTMSECIR